MCQLEIIIGSRKPAGRVCKAEREAERASHVAEIGII